MYNKCYRNDRNSNAGERINAISTGIGMIYSIVYDAVRKKASTTPPNELIGNTEMAAGIGIILKELNKELDLAGIKQPKDIKEQFLAIMEHVDMAALSGEAGIIFEKVKKYKVKEMVNETLQDLERLAKYEDNTD